VTPSIYSLFVLGAFASCVLTPLVRHLASKYGIVDCPKRARKVHEESVPRLGGAAVLGSFLITMLVGGLLVPELSSALWSETGSGVVILFGAVAIFVIGFLDDFNRLSAKTRLLTEFVVAAVVVWQCDLLFTEVRFLGIGQLPLSEWGGFTLACLWIVGMTNALNLIDGLDGLAAGVTLFGLAAVATVGHLAGVPHVTWMSTLLLGCILGFLVFNSRPASIFLGDCGSLTLGYLVGCFSLMGSFRATGAIDGLFPILAFLVPVADCLFAIVRRTLRGRSPFSPDMEHFHHRLMERGLSHGKAVLALWAAAACSAAVAVGAAFGRGDQLTALFVAFGLVGFVLLRYLGYFRLATVGMGFRSLIRERESAKEVEQLVGELETEISRAKKLTAVEKIVGRAAPALGFARATMQFFEDEKICVLGTEVQSASSKIREVITWGHSLHRGFFDRSKEFKVEFELTGRRFCYGKAIYHFNDGRQELAVHEEILLERIHDAILDLAGRVRRKELRKVRK
jgi:UDP-GlcNAc:undecaprenyl-phosphate/decaprenyl-phosphate GlcNAc-1-phosphate transferase